MPNSAQPESAPTVYTNPNTGRKIIPVLIGLIVLAGAAGFAGGVYYDSRKNNISPDNLQKILPLPLELLSNKIFTEWRGYIDGKVTDKNESNSTLTVEKDKNRITIKYFKPLTRIFDTTRPQSSEVTFADIKVNSLVRAELWPVGDGKVPLSGNAGDIVARQIEVYQR